MVAIAQTVLPIPLYQKQANFLRSTSWLTGFVGGRGTGKSYIGGYRVNRTAKKGEPWICVSPDAGVVSETTLPTFIEICERLNVFVRKSLTPYPKVWWRTHDGGIANIVFRSAEKPDKLHGPNKAGLWLDEASLQPLGAFEAVIPTLRYRGKMGPCLMTFTPKGRRNWTFEKFYEEVGEDEIESVDPKLLLWVNGRAYKPKPRTCLIAASTRDNPFLPPEFYDTIRANYSARLAQQELEGDFIDVAGLMFARDWFEYVDHVPRDAMRVRYWDRAGTPGDGCYSVGLLMARDSRGIYYIEDVVRGQWSPAERNRWMTDTAEKDAKKYAGEVLIYAEEEGGSAGIEVSQQMIRMLAGYPVFRDRVSGARGSRSVDGDKLPGEAKIVRATPLAAQAEGGNVKIVTASWTQDFLDEITAFPEYAFADQVDAASGAFNKLAQNSGQWTGPAEKSKHMPNTGEKFGAALALGNARARRRNLFGKE